MRLYWKRKR